ATSRSAWPSRPCSQGRSEPPAINNTKGYIGHAMGAAGALELAGNLPAFADRLVHPTINLEEPDPECWLPQFVAQEAVELPSVDAVLNNSFGMLGINSVVVIKRFTD
ncbi:MAG: beta-ketoacyl-[acyl-carrier-protein] synthase family protein, partial [Myxococcales bacterium]|nr:beta-ketoacyl-[acyl-carrier-protein] synthase family protein [Myxococcales bacterium]